MSTRHVFDHSFIVNAPLAAVAAFHRDAGVLPRLTPPPIGVQLHRVDPLAEGAIAAFTLWFGPLPVRWVAVHSQVDPLRGFTDTQRSGPLKFWRHTHTFEGLDGSTTRVSEHVEFEYHAGWRGWLSRLLYNWPALEFLFAYRAWVTRRAVGARLAEPNGNRQPG
jgi:ligand-binding SRPBCC domain-containing protein